MPADSSVETGGRDFRLLVLIAAGLILLAAGLPDGSDPEQRAGGELTVPADEETVYCWLADGKGEEGLYRLRAGKIEQRLAEAGYTMEPLPPRVAYLLGKPLAINLADEELLCSLPGIGPVLAGRLVEERRNRGGFRSEADLLSVQGIGNGKLARFRHAITFE